MIRPWELCKQLEEISLKIGADSLGFVQGNNSSSWGINWLILGQSFSLSREIGYSLAGCALCGKEIVIYLYSSD